MARKRKPLTIGQRVVVKGYSFMEGQEGTVVRILEPFTLFDYSVQLDGMKLAVAFKRNELRKVKHES